MVVVRPYQFEPTYSGSEAEEDSESTSSGNETSTERNGSEDDVSTRYSCGKCSRMEWQIENICCQAIPRVQAKVEATHRCIANGEAFSAVVLNEAVLETALVGMMDVGFSPLPDPLQNR